MGGRVAVPAAGGRVGGTVLRGQLAARGVTSVRGGPAVVAALAVRVLPAVRGRVAALGRGALGRQRPGTALRLTTAVLPAVLTALDLTRGVPRGLLPLLLTVRQLGVMAAVLRLTTLLPVLRLTTLLVMAPVPPGRRLLLPLPVVRRRPLLAGGRGGGLLVGAPGVPPGLAAGRRRGGVPAGGRAVRTAGRGRTGRHARQQGLTTVRGQHDAFARLARRGLLALSTLRHRDSYQWGTL